MIWLVALTHSTKEKEFHLIQLQIYDLVSRTYSFDEGEGVSMISIYKMR